MKPCNIASADFLRQIELIKPSVCGGQLHFPCSILLKSGERIERALCVEKYKDFESDTWIHPSDVDRIEETPTRMPPRLATKLYRAGETGMGYEIFKMKMKSGERFVFVTNSIVDFPDLPDGYTTGDVARVCPFRGRKGIFIPRCHQGASFQWCFYMKNNWMNQSHKSKHTSGIIARHTLRCAVSQAIVNLI
jgi:hypothetical protein